MSFIRDIVSGVRWSAIGRYGEHGVGFVTTAVLAHLVSPEAFGLLALAALVTGFLSSIADLGTATTLVQREVVPRSLESTVFWVSLATSTLLAAVAWLVAPAVALFFREPQVAPVLRFLAVGLLFSGAGAVPTALLTRDLAFDRLARVQLTAAAVGGAVGISMALGGLGVWSLVGLYLARTFLEATGVFLVSTFRPVLQVDRRQLASVVSFGANLSGFQVANFVTRNVDNLVIGRFLGPTMLGYYDIAWRLIEYPKAALSGVVGRVMVPTYARMQSDDERFGRAYVRVVASIGLISIPMLLGLMLVAEPVVLLFFGESWGPSVILVSILAPVGLAQTMGATSGSVYIAKARTDWLFGWSLVAGLVTTLGVVVGLQWGIVGIAVGRLIANSTLFPVNLGISLRLVRLRLSDLWRLVRPLAAAGIVMVAAVVALRTWLDAVGLTGGIVDLVASVALGAAVYVGIIWRVRPPIVDEIFVTLDAAGVATARRSMPRARTAKE